MSPTRMSKIESAIRAALAYHEAFNRHDVAGLMELISEDCRFETMQPAPDGLVFTGKKAIGEYLQTCFSLFADAHLEIEEVYGFGERCIMRWKYTWSDDEGSKQHIRGVDIFREKNGLICEKVAYTKGA